MFIQIILAECAIHIATDTASHLHEFENDTPLAEDSTLDPLSTTTDSLSAHTDLLSHEDPRDLADTPSPPDVLVEDDSSSDRSSIGDEFFDADTGSTPSTPRQETFNAHVFPIVESSDSVNAIDGSDDIASKESVDVEPVDAVDMVNGMYRILDLVSERGSSGYGWSPQRSLSFIC